MTVYSITFDTYEADPRTRVFSNEALRDSFLSDLLEERALETFNYCFTTDSELDAA